STTTSTTSVTTTSTTTSTTSVTTTSTTTSTTSVTTTSTTTSTTSATTTTTSVTTSSSSSSTSTTSSTSSTSTTSKTTSTSSTSTTSTTTPTLPTAVSSLSSFCGCTNFTLSLTNILFNTTGASYQWQSSISGQNIWSNVSAVSSTASFPVSFQVNATDYKCQIIVQFPALMIFTSTLVTVTNAYCAPLVISCSSADTMNDFILRGESGTLINDVATGCAAGAYDNRTSQTITLYTNLTYVALVSTQYSSLETVGIWIDFNNNFLFESFERVAYQSLNSTLDTPITITIPSISSGAVLGTHRMRAQVAYNRIPNPCAASITYGETHDYTVNIIPYTPTNITYSQLFIMGVNPVSQCAAWANFVAQLTIRPYNLLILSGSMDPVGVKVLDPVVIGNIALALQTSTAYGPVSTNSRSWAVGSCGSPYELSASGAVCYCVTGYNIRPCVGNGNFGGINGLTCSAANQTMTVIFQY
ncbi:unnamed protein product, partial [Adineta ricciae]